MARSQEWFTHNEGTPLEQVVTELGVTMEQIRERRRHEERDPAARALELRFRK